MGSDSIYKQPVCDNATLIESELLIKMKFKHLPWLAIFVVLLLSWWLRILYIEPQELAIVCESGVTDLACTMRKGMTGIFYDNAVGFTVFASSLIAIILRSRYLALSAAMLGMAGIVIHGGLHTGVEFATVGFVLSFLYIGSRFV